MTDPLPDTRVSSRSILTVGVILVALVVMLLILRQVAQLVLVVFAGVLMGVLLDGLARRAVKHLPISRGVALTLILTLSAVAVVGGAWLAGPQVAAQVSELAQRIPTAIEQIKLALTAHDWGKWIVENMPSTREILPFGSRQLVSVPDAFSSIAGIVAALLIVFFVGIYLAANPRVYVENLLRLFPSRNRPRAREVIQEVTHALQRWLVGRLATMFVVGVLIAIGLSLINLPLAFTLALIAALMAFIPFIGPTLATIPALLVGLAESPAMMVYVLIVYVVVETLEGYLITPLIQRRAVSIPPALLITFQILMGALFGPAGLFLATPTAVGVIVSIQLLYVEGVLGDRVTVLGHR